MSNLKERIEELNNLYFRLNGMHAGSVELVEKEGFFGREFDFFKSLLSVDILGIYLEMLDDAVVEKVEHSLKCDPFQYNIYQEKFKNAALMDVSSKAQAFCAGFERDVNSIRKEVNAMQFKCEIFDMFCDEMIELSKTIRSGLFHVVNSKSRKKVDESEELGQK